MVVASLARSIIANLYIMYVRSHAGKLNQPSTYDFSAGKPVPLRDETIICFIDIELNKACLTC